MLEKTFRSGCSIQVQKKFRLFRFIIIPYESLTSSRKIGPVPYFCDFWHPVDQQDPGMKNCAFSIPSAVSPSPFILQISTCVHSILSSICYRMVYTTSGLYVWVMSNKGNRPSCFSVKTEILKNHIFFDTY
jgi:hypothetical protein